MASPKVQKRYSKPAKVVPKKDPAAAEAPPMPMSDPAPEASPTSGTDGIPVGERHGAERTSMMERQTQELKELFLLKFRFLLKNKNPILQELCQVTPTFHGGNQIL